MKKIKLTWGQYALVDNEDFDYLNQFKWGCFKRGKYTSYAVRKKKRRTTYMHREITAAKNGMLTDHIDGDGLNNQKSNLRIVTSAQNQANRHPKKVGSSGIVGVYFRKRYTKKPWEARYSKNNKWLFIGGFQTKEEAADAYNKTVVKERG